MSEIAPAAAGAGASSLILGATPLGWFSAASGLIGAAAAGPAPAGPAISSARSDSLFNSSGWTVATGSGKASGTVLPWYVYALAGLAIIAWYKKK